VAIAAHRRWSCARFVLRDIGRSDADVT